MSQSLAIRLAVLVTWLFATGCMFNFDRSLSPGEITGTAVYVSAQGTLVPATGAAVTLENSTLSVTADGKGRFVIEGLPAGTFNLDATAIPGGLISSEVGLRLTGLAIAAGNGLDLGQIELDALGTIRGAVTLDGSPIGAGAVATIPGLAETPVIDGVFQFPVLLPGAYQVAVFYQDNPGALVSPATPVQVHPASTARISVGLDSQTDLVTAGAVQGTVQLSAATTASGVDVQFSGSGPDLTTNGTGGYSSSNLPAALYTVTASLGGFLSVSVPGVLVGGGTTIVPAITLIPTTTGATPDAGPQSCEEDSECPAGQSCSAGVCGIASDGGPFDAGLTDAGAVDVGSDGGLSDGGLSDGGSFADAGPDAGPFDAGSFVDAGVSPEDAGAMRGGMDGGALDAGSPDGGVVDAGAPDSGVADAGAPDSGVVDAGPPDSGVVDAGPPDSGVADAGVPPGWTIGGTIAGAFGTVVLADNGSNELTQGNGAFVFTNALPNGSPYEVTVVSSPSGQLCLVQQGSGSALQNVTNVAVVCETNPGSGCLRDSDCGYDQVCFNGTCAERAVNANGLPCTGTSCAAMLCMGVVSQASCAVAGCEASLTSEPPGNVDCNPSYLVGGTVSGLGAGTLVLEAGSESVTIDSNGAFVFADPFPYGADDTVTVGTMPTGEVCTVSQAATIVTGSASVSVSCVTQFSISVQVSGLSGSLTLSDGIDSLPISSNGGFTFPTALDAGSLYEVSVTTQPTGQFCTVTPASGTLTGDLSLPVSCLPLYTISGQVTGLTGTLGLTDGIDTLSLSANTGFMFPTPLVSGAPFDVTLTAQPPGELCTVANGSSAGIAGNVIDVAVTCVPAFTVGGTVAGLTGTLILTDNGSDMLTVSSDGPFTFLMSIASPGSFSVTVATQPAGESCVVSNSSGTGVDTNVTNVTITCNVLIGGTVTSYEGPAPIQVVSATYGGNCGAGTGNATSSVGGDCNGQASCSYGVSTGVLGDPAGGCAKAFAVSWLCGSFPDPFQATIPAEANGQSVTLNCPNLTLQDNGSDNLTITANGPFTFPTGVTGGGSYSAAVLTQPPGQLCVITNGSGTNVTSNVTSITVTCTSYYTVGGTLSGLPAEPVINIVSGTYGDNCGVPVGNVTAQLTTACGGVGGSCRYGINNLGDPAGGCAKDYVAVWTCSTWGLVQQATIPGEATGQTVTLSCPDLVLQDNLTDNLTPTGNGQFTFFTPLLPFTGYSVSIAQQPAGETCVVASGAGTTSSDVSSVGVSCQGFATVSGTLSGFNGAPLVNVVAGTYGANCGVPTGNATTPLTAACAGQLSCSLNSGSLPDAAPGCQKDFIAQWTCGVGTHIYTDVLPSGGIAELSCSPFVIDDNNDDDLTDIVNGPFTFAAQVGPGESYDVTVTSQPSDQQCMVANGSGVMTQSPVTDVAVTCADLYNIGGMVAGLTGTLVLFDNGVDTLTLDANGSFQFPTELLDLAPYAVTVSMQPSGQSCTIIGASGNVMGGDVTSVVISCVGP